MAPPSKLTPETHDQIVTLVRAGNFRETACAAAGITSRSLRDWLSRGAKGEQPYKQFLEALDAAEAHAEARDIVTITAAAQKDWKAAAWRLERKAPKRWMFRVREELQRQLDEIFERLEKELEPEVFERVLRIALGAPGEGAVGEAGSGETAATGATEDSA